MRQHRVKRITRGMGGPERCTQILELRRVLRTTNVREQGPEVDNEGENSNRRRESWIRSERMTLRDSRAAAVRLDQRRLIRNGVPPADSCRSPSLVSVAIVASSSD